MKKDMRLRDKDNNDLGNHLVKKINQDHFSIIPILPFITSVSVDEFESGVINLINGYKLVDLNSSNN